MTLPVVVSPLKALGVAAATRRGVCGIRGVVRRRQGRQSAVMTREEFNSFCGSLKATSHVAQWGNADVWKAGGKVFAICGWHEGGPAFTFKVGDIAFQVLGSERGIRTVPYLASRGMKWLQVHEDGAISEVSLREHIMASYDLVAAGLTRKKRIELGLWGTERLCWPYRTSRATSPNLTSHSKPAPGFTPEPLSAGGAVRVEVPGQARDGWASSLLVAC